MSFSKFIGRLIDPGVLDIFDAGNMERQGIVEIIRANNGLNPGWNVVVGVVQTLSVGPLRSHK